MSDISLCKGEKKKGRTLRKKGRCVAQCANIEPPSEVSLARKNNFSVSQARIFNRTTKDIEYIKYLQQTIDPIKVRDMRDKEFSQLCETLIQELLQKKPVYLSHVANERHPYWEYLRNDLLNTYNCNLERFVRSKSYKKLSKGHFADICNKGMLIDTYPNSPFGKVLATCLKRNIGVAYSLRDKCCDHPIILMETMKTPIVKPDGLCELHDGAVDRANSFYKRMNAVKKFPLCPVDITRSFTNKLLKEEMSTEDWGLLYEFSASYRMNLSISTSVRYWRIGHLFEHNSHAYSQYLGKLIRGHVDFSAQGVFDFITGGIFKEVPTVINDVSTLLRNVNDKVVDETGQILTFIRERIENVDEVRSILTQLSSLMAVGTTLIGLAYVINFTEILAQLNVLYNLLPCKMSMSDILSSACGASYSLIEQIMGAPSDMHAQGLLDMLPSVDSSHNFLLTQIAWGILCAGISGKVMTESSLRGFIGKYGLSQMRGFGFDALFSYVKNGDASSRVVEFLQDLLNLCGFDFMTWNRLLHSFESVLAISEEVHRYLRVNEDLVSFSRKPDSLETVEQWIKTVDDFQLQFASNLRSFMQGRQSQCMTMTQTVQQLKRELIIIKQKVTFNIQHSREVNQALWIDFVGASGIGKTWTLKNRIFPVLQEKCGLSALYTRSKTKHFDGHTDETCFLYDDYNQMDDDKAKEIFELTSGCPMILPKASAEEKGVAIIPSMVFTTANTPHILKVAKVASLEAFERRRSYLFETRINPSDCPLHNTMPDFMSCGKVTCGRTADLQSLQYRSKPTFSRMWSSKQCGDWMSFDQFLPTLIKLIKKHQESVQVIDKEEFDQYYCNMDKAQDLPSYTSSPCFEQPSTHIDVDIPTVHVDGMPVSVKVEVPQSEDKGVFPFQGIRVFSHNLNGYKDSRLDKEISYLWNQQFDVLCLQEVSTNQRKRLAELSNYKIYCLNSKSDITLVTLVKSSWRCKRVKPLILTDRGVVSLDFDSFTVTNLHLKKGETVYYPTEDNHIFCGDVQGDIPQMQYGEDLTHDTWGNMPYDIIGSTSSILYQYENLGAFQSDHCALSARIALFQAEGFADEFSLDRGLLELLRSASKSKLKAILNLLHAYRKDGGDVFAYLWEDIVCHDLQQTLKESNLEMFSDPVLANVLFAFIEFVKYYLMAPNDTRTLAFLLARVQAFLLHVTQPEDLLVRMGRHAQYNAEKWENKSNVDWILSIFKYILSSDFSGIIRIADYHLPTGFDRMKSFMYDGLSFTPSYFSATFAKSFSYVKATVCDVATWASLVQFPSFLVTFKNMCCVSLEIYSVMQTLKDIAKEWIQYIKNFMLSHPIIATGGLLLFLGAAYILYNRKENADARIISYDDMYNTMVPQEKVMVHKPSSDGSAEEVTFMEDVEFLPTYVDEDSVEQVRRDKKRSQGMIAPNEGTLSSLEKNTCIIKANGYSLGGIFIGGTTLMLPKHFLDGSRVQGLSSVLLSFGSEPIECMVDFSDPKQCVKMPRMDVMFINFSCNRLNARRRIVNHFLPARELKNVASEDILLLTRDSKEMSRFVQRYGKAHREMDFVYTVENKRVISHMGLRYALPTVAGDCGSLVVLANGTYNSKLYGFHVAGSAKAGLGYGQGIPREIVTKALQYFDDWKQEPVVIANGFISEEKLNPTERAIVVPGSLEGQGNFTYMGTLPRSKIPYAPSKTDLRQTVLYGRVVPSEKAPAALQSKEVNGVMVHPMKASLDKYAVPLKPFSPVLLNRIQEFCVRKYKVIAKELNHDFSLYSDEENILGRERGLSRMPANTSTGYPYTLKGIKKVDCFDYETGEISNQELRDDIQRTEERLIAGHHSGHVWTDCLKDEKRSLEKVEACKTRTFAIPSVTISFLTRKYFGSIVDFLVKCKVRSSFSVGIDPEGPEWTSLFAKHNSHSGNIVAGDYSKYDGTSPPEMIQLFANFCNELCRESDGEDADKNARVRLQLCNELSHTLHLCENLLYYTHQGIPSGSPLTVYVNSAIGEYLVMYAYLELAQDYQIPASLTTFAQDVVLSTYGDDNLMSVADSVLPWFNFDMLKSKFAEYGITYTPESKTEDSYISKSIFDVSFLKRAFVRDKKDARKILAPIDKGSIHELFNWCRKDTNAQETLYINIEDAFRKAHAHGKKYFYELQDKVNAELADLCMPEVDFSWEELDYLWRAKFY